MDDTLDAPANAEPTPLTASSQAAGPLGFTGTAPTTTSAPAGMVHLAADGTSDTVPLLPTTWATDNYGAPGRA